MERRSNDVFISWSGKESGPLVAALASMIRLVFANQVQVFTSFQSIGLGTEWLSHLKDGMSCEIALFLLNPQNVNAPWINIEAGMAIQAAENSGKPRLVPVLLGLTVKELPHLFSTYQGIRCDREGIRRLLNEINEARVPPLMPQEFVDVSFNAHWEKLGNEVEKATREIMGAMADVAVTNRKIDDSPGDLWKAHFDWCPSARWRHCCLVLSNPREAGGRANTPDANFYELISRHLTDGTRVTHVHFDDELIAGFEVAIQQDELVPDYVKRQLFHLLARVIIPKKVFRQVADCVLFDIEYTSGSRGYHSRKRDDGATIVWEQLEPSELQKRADILQPYLRELDELRRGYHAAYLRVV